jgi:hypothetical protein
LRRPPGGYELVRGLLRRGVVVKPKANWRTAGITLFVAGVAIMAWCNIQDPDLLGIGRVLVIVGALAAVFAKLNERTERSTEDYREGYDKGKDDGYAMRVKEEGLKAKPERPVVVDMSDRIDRNRTQS